MYVCGVWVGTGYRKESKGQLPILAYHGNFPYCPINNLLWHGWNTIDKRRANWRKTLLSLKTQQYLCVCVARGGRRCFRG